MHRCFTPDTQSRAFQGESSFTWMVNEKGLNWDSYTSKHSSPLRVVKTKKGTRPRSYAKIQQHAFADEGWSSATTRTWGSDSYRRVLLRTFATPFNREITENPRLKKVKIPFVEPFDGTTDPNDHWDVYKAQMYIQDVDDSICCWYFPTTQRGIA